MELAVVDGGPVLAAVHADLVDSSHLKPDASFRHQV